jgi:hypothetical protein
MIRRRSKLFASLAAISFVCFIASISLWVRSRSSSDMLFWSDKNNGQMIWIFWWSGELVIHHLSGNVSWGLSSGFHFNNAIYPDVPMFGAENWNGWYHSIAGAGCGHLFAVLPNPRSNYADTVLALPFRLITALTAILPAIAAMQFLKRRALGQGLCAHCGYDLRATPDRCPECGSMPTKSKSTQPHSPPYTNSTSNESAPDDAPHARSKA